MKCVEKDCPNEAVCAIQLNVPARGHEIHSHTPIAVCMNVTLCDIHFKTTKPDQFFGIADSPLEDFISVQSKGRTDPDFGRAFISRCTFDSPEWAALSKARSK